MISDSSFIEVATVVKAHGLNGDIKVFSLTRQPQDLNKYKVFYIREDSGDFTKLEVAGISIAGKSIRIKFTGFNHIDDVQPFINKPLFIHRDQLAKLEGGEYYISDLIGVQVILSDGAKLGVITDVFEYPANDVYLVVDEGRELMIPATKETILKVDIDNRVMIVNLLEGLEELT